MALEAVQAQAGHASIESTRIYLHLADDWLAAQYRKARRPLTRRSSSMTWPRGAPGERRPGPAAGLGPARHRFGGGRRDAPLPGTDRLRAAAAQRGER